MSAQETMWFYADANNQSLGPVSLAELWQLSATGVITPDSFVIENGGTEWKTLRSVAAKPSTPPPVPTSLPPQSAANKPRRWPAVVCVLLLYPVGLIALWLSKGFSKSQKWIVTGVSLGLFAIGISAHYGGFIFLVIIANSLLFTWWAQNLGRVWKIAISAIVCLLFLPPAFIRPPKSANESSIASISNPAINEESAPVQSSSEKIEKSLRVKLNEQFRLGEFSYRVIGSEYPQMEIGNRFTRVEAAPEGVFVIVHYEITNESNKTRTVVADDFILRDANGREFSPSSRATTALMMTEESKDFLLSELQPGLTKRAVTAFEIRRDSYAPGLTLVIPEKGWGGRQKEVPLK